MQYSIDALKFLNKNCREPDDMLLNGVMGLAAESGEVLDLVKKYKFHNKPLNKDELIKELGDVRWYIALILKTLDVTLEEIEQKNLEKLNKRHPNGFSGKYHNE